MNWLGKIAFLSFSGPFLPKHWPKERRESVVKKSTKWPKIAEITQICLPSKGSFFNNLPSPCLPLVTASC
jgi:hypothetical protein